MTWRIIAVLTTILTLVVNGLATALPLNGLTTAEISDSFSVFFVPAGYVFSIWGVIYLLLIAFSAYLFTTEGKNDPVATRILPWYVVSAFANSIWLFCWHYQQFGLSVVVMLVLLATLLRIYTLLPTPTTRAQTWARNLPFSVYLGWISVATIANVSAYLDLISWSAFGLSERTWAVIMVIVAGLLGSLMAIRKREIAYPLVIAWALIGISVNFPEQSTITRAVIVSTIMIMVALIASVRSSSTPARTT